MSQDITITIKDDATPALLDKLGKCDPERLAKAMLPPLREHWRDHLAAMPKNRGGYPSTGFWEGAARSVEQQSYAAGGTIFLRGSGPPGRPGLRQRYHGGTIEAANHANLTIPICSEAYGTTVKDWGFDNLQFVKLADGRKFFALKLGGQGAVKKAFKGKWSRAETTIKRAVKAGVLLRGTSPATISRAEKHMGLKFLFKLQPSVEQEPNEDVIPDDLGEVAVAAAEEALK